MRVVERTGQMRFANGTALFNHHFIKLGFLDAWKKTGARQGDRSVSAAAAPLERSAFTDG
jgi:hypothetical protein